MTNSIGYIRYQTSSFLFILILRFDIKLFFGEHECSMNVNALLWSKFSPVASLTKAMQQDNNKI